MDGLNAHIDRIYRASEARQKRVRLFYALWPVLLFSAVIVSLAAIGLFDRVAPIWQTLISLISLAAFSILGALSFGRWQDFEQEDLSKAIDTQTEHRVISAFADKPASLNPKSLEIWNKHRDGVAGRVLALRPVNFGKAWRKIDPFFGIRLITPLIVLVCFVMVGSKADPRLSRFLFPDIGVLFGAQNTEVVAWITPPEYTQAATIYLENSTNRIDTLENSRLSVRAKTGWGRPRLLSYNAQGQKTEIPMEKGNDAVWSAETTLSASAKLVVDYWGPRRSWLAIIAQDTQPTIELLSPPIIDPKGRVLLDWKADDDFGVVAVELSMQISPNIGTDIPSGTVVMTQSLALQGPVKQSREDVSILDMMRHAWAGEDVSLRLAAYDEAGQTGYSETYDFTLPEFVFIQTLARALQEVRTDVLRATTDYDTKAADDTTLSPAVYAPERMAEAMTKLSDLTDYPEVFFDNRALYLALSTAKTRLENARSLEEAYRVDDLLWQAAMMAEYGASSDARKALEAARKALARGLRNKVGPSVMSRLVEAYERAVQNYLAARMAEGLEEESQDNGDGPAMGGSSPQISMSDIAEMMKLLEKLTAEGKTEEAAELLAEITRLLEQLQFQQGQGGSSGSYGQTQEGGGEESDEEAEEESEFEKELAEKLAELSDILRQQREVNDDTLSEQRQQSQNGQTGQGRPSAPGDSMDGAGGDSGSGAWGGAEADAEGQSGESLRDRQEALRKMAEEFGRNRGLNLGDGLSDDGSGEFGEFGDSKSAGEDSSDQDGQGAGGEKAGDETAEIGAGGKKKDSQNERSERADGSGIIGQTLTDKDIEALKSILADMAEAEQALARKNYRKANNDQNKALNSLRDLSDDVSQRIDQARSQRKGESNGGAGGQGDPLGRPLGAAGVGNDVQIPEKQARQRAKDVLDQIRERYNNAKTEEEREYLESLLEQF